MSHQPRQKQAEGGTAKIKVNPTQVRQEMGHPVYREARWKLTGISSWRDHYALHKFTLAAHPIFQACCVAHVFRDELVFPEECSAVAFLALNEPSRVRHGHSVFDDGRTDPFGLRISATVMNNVVLRRPASLVRSFVRRACVRVLIRAISRKIDS